jgi:predicted RNA polymerase sigma factor
VSSGADATAAPAPAAGAGAGVASDRVLTRVVRAESARIVTALARSFGDLDLAEEAFAGAVEAALREWRVRGVPANPAAWLTTAARHDALDRLRRERRLREKIALLSDPPAPSAPSAPQRVPTPADERLPLLFGCCHPALAPEAQLALSLRAVLGLTTAQIARATLEPLPTVAQRISRAKRKIVASGIPLRVPAGDELAPRLDRVLAMISVMYDAAHLRVEADASADRDLAEDALWLAQVVADELPGEAEAHGLLAYLRFHRAREAARAVGGEFIPLPQQDRRLWDAALIAEARAGLERAAALGHPGRWQLQAAIAACHADAATAADTDWPQVLVLYDLVLIYDRSPFVRLNRVVALAEVAGAPAALRALDELEPRLAGSHLWHAVRAELLRREGHTGAAIEADRRARELTANHAERELLAARISAAGLRPERD